MPIIYYIFSIYYDKGENMKELLSNIEPYSFTTLAFLIGIILTKELSSEEQGSVGNWLQLVGLTMQTYSSQNAITSNNEKNDKKLDIDTLKKAIKKIEEEVDNLTKVD